MMNDTYYKVNQKNGLYKLLTLKDIYTIMAQFGNITNTGKAKVSSKYGPRNIGKGKSRNHKGIDISYPSGTSITSPLDGVIERASSNVGGCGGLIVINHGQFNGKNVKSKYCHVKKINVNKGQEVKKGEVVGLSGGGKNDVGRGNSTGPHIHFEIYENGVNVNPLSYYQNSPSGEQSELPSGSEINTNDSDTDDSVGGKNSQDNARQIAKNLLMKLFGAGETSTVTPEVVNEVLRHFELVSEQTPTFLTQPLTTTTTNTQTNTSVCGPYDTPIKPCSSRTENNGGVNWSGPVNSKIFTETTGKIEPINKGNWGNAYKIGDTEYYWNGSFNKITGTTVSSKEQIGTGDKLFIRKFKSGNQTAPNQAGNNNSSVNKSTNSQTTTDEYKGQARDMAKSILTKLMGGGTQAPQTSNESIEKLKNVISEEIKMFNKLIK